jgi:Xaa-Pro dipeptidase
LEVPVVTVPQRYPAFDSHEYQTRLAAVRHAMGERGVDALLLADPRSSFYLTGSESESVAHLQCLIVPSQGGMRLVTWEFEASVVCATSVLSAADLSTYGGADDPVERIANAVIDAGLAGARIGVELRARELHAAAVDQLRARLPGARLVDSWGIVEGCRLRKSPAEVALMRRAAALTDDAVQSACETIGPGVTDGEVAAAITASLYAGGSGTVAWGPIVAAGMRSGIGHASFNGSRIAVGEVVFLELSGQVHRYVAPVMRTVSVGPPSAEVAAVRDAGLAALDATIRAARPGASASDVAAAGLSALGSIRDHVSFHGVLGYPVGIGFPPTWNERLGFDLRLDNPEPLEAGMVFHLPISLRIRRRFGVGQSQTVVITSDGAEALSQSSAAMHVVSV